MSILDSLSALQNTFIDPNHHQIRLTSSKNKIMPILDNNMLTVCHGCRTTIDDRYYLMAVDRSWHLSCLKCFDCGMSLEQERTCFARYGQIFCKDDYIKRYCSRVCARCHTVIRQDEVILRAKQYIFHLDCFTCINCNVHLHPGDEFGLKDDLIFCRHHFFEQQQQQQSLSLQPIGPQQQNYDPHLSSRMLDMGIDGHSIPHTISLSTNFLDDSGYYTSPLPTLIPSTPSTSTSTSTGTVNTAKRTRKRKERIQGQQLIQVQQHQDETIPPSDHFLSLSPSASNMVGNDGSLYAPSLDSSFYVDVVDMEGTSTSNNGLHSHQGNNSNLSNGSHQHHHHHHHARQKRVRTSFKHHQLRCMRSYFNLNHNPDAKDLKNLAEKTNLPKRVLQVWFQNARAKYRRSVSRSDNSLSSTAQHSSIGQQQNQVQSQASSAMTNMLDIHSNRTEREDTTNSSNLSSPTESIHSKTSSMNFSESETCGSM